MPSSMFSNINNVEIHGGIFTMENHMIQNMDLERLRPSHKADYRNFLGEQALKREECTAGTRVKILESITKWADDYSPQSPRVFWLTGQAGSGKTTIAYTITKRFEKGGDAGLRTILGGNFLCSRQFEETRDRSRIIPTIVYQYAHVCKPYANALNHAKKFDAVYHDVATQLKDLLVGPWRHIKRGLELPLYLFVIDALDEINDGGGSAFLRDLLTTIDESNLRGFKFLVTSRPDPGVVTLCNSFTSEAVCWLQRVPIEEAELDIRTYLNTKLPKLENSPELAELVRQADGLFIYAATAVKYLTPHRSITVREQTKMLKRLISKSDIQSSANDGTFLIDVLYRQILVDAFSKFKDEFLISRLRILFTLLCTAERTSTSVVTALVAEGDVDVALAVVEDLHAVLYTQGDRIFWFHGSFPDFIFDPARSNFDSFAFWCNKSAHDHLLGKSCFRVMMSGLRFNMGDITSSFLFDSDNAEALSEKVRNNISPVLRYSIRHWALHLPSPQLIKSDQLRLCISEFLQIRVLFWIEAMNLLKLRNLCSPILQHAREWVRRCGDSDLARDIGEAANFATYFSGSPAAESTPHLYISALATWTQDTGLCRRWKYQFSRIPVFKHTRGRVDVPLMTVVAGAAAVKAVAFSMDGLRIVSGSEDQTVRVWDASTGAELNVMKGHKDRVNSVAFSIDDMRIVSGSNDETVRVWDISTGEVLNVLKGHTHIVSSVTFSGDGIRIASGSYDMTVRVWGASTGVELRVLKGHTDWIESVAFSGDGMQIVSGSDDETVRVWDVSTGAELRVLKGHTHFVNSVEFSRDGTRILSGSNDQTVRIWDALTGEVLKVLEGHTHWVKSVSFSKDCLRIMSGSYDKTVRMWDALTGAELNVRKGHTDRVNSVAFSMDSLRIVSGSFDNTVRVWDASKGAVMDVLKGHTDKIDSVAFSRFSRDGMRIVSGSYDTTVRVWDASTGAELSVLKGHIYRVESVAFSGDGLRIVSGSYATVRVWGVSTGEVLLVLNGHTDWVVSVAFSEDGIKIVSGSTDRTVRIWDASVGAELRVLKHHTLWVKSVSLSRDGTRIVSGSGDKTVLLWDASTGAVLTVLRHYHTVNSVVFARDGIRIASGSDDKTVGVWNSSTGVQLHLLEGHTGSVTSVAFSGDGKWIVSGSYDRTVRLWDAWRGIKLRVLEGHTDLVKSVSLSRDGMLIVSGSYDNTLRIWDLSSDSRFPYHLAQTNWIISSRGHDHLMWVPQEAQVIAPPTKFIISRQGFGTVDFRQAMIGVDWRGCYTPSGAQG